ncbi:DNA/RNA non-specific endonuclease [Bradyrhizobium sp. 149]|uniref:DNA/RNA non-specific endonuclease n=1 Tax=Bradyrhizobium sp. 149 TaxID=2782624 RepID=UPI001FF9F86A|nr:DNA/RNA non-specific endonuclease [Bradyrhizobium sp. 149]MCK1654675.1 DNA/RNA non-specific endonuclease [Bradyrhizobium sp. 149]
MSKEGRLSKLRQFNASIRATDSKLSEESADLGVSAQMLPEPAGPEDMDHAIAEESIVMRRFRPVLAIKENDTELVFKDKEEGTLWEERLKKAKTLLEPAIRAVGRIDLIGADFQWIGTGWLVADNMIVTNRHVANEFAMRSGDGFTFKVGSAGRIGAAVDFLQEIGNDKQLVFRLVRPLHIEPQSGPDISLFEIEMISGDTKLAQPIRLAKNPTETNGIAVIGYPAYDSRIPDTDLMESMYGKIYNKKRLAPGGITRLETTRLLHNCTTLGGNSGSVVLDLDSGEAFGLHFSGTFMTTNYAVRSDVIARVIADVRAGRPRREKPGPDTAALTSNLPPPPPPGPDSGGRSVSLTIPLKITVSIGEGGEDALSIPRLSRPPTAPTMSVEDDAEGTEATTADYRNRNGYQASFLGARNVIELPVVERDAHDVLELEDGSGTELKYEHYSVVMNRARRMCFFSAVNIDGKNSVKSARVAWKWDPRIPRSQQIMNECYGNPPKFSRGHMTRREDPGWGDPETAKRGNQDSMHVTNVTPQMQAFNAPIWLALEDYALQHAREDEMKISVFTGPYFKRSDSTMHGVRIPVSFWKIIAFIHDDTRKLCATGYEMTQKENLPEEEFVFGQFNSKQLKVATQVAIRSIEAKSGISFGRLALVDPFGDEEEGFADERNRAPLEAFEQIRFVR